MACSWLLATVGNVHSRPIWGVGCALLEQSEIDLHAARCVNDNITEYLIAANAVVHATGRRVRKLPIRIEDLLLRGQ